MRKLPAEKRAMLLTALGEGNSINSVCRMFGVGNKTVLRLLADAGTLAAQYHDLIVRNLQTKRVQVDEIWSFCHTKQKNVRAENVGKGHGDVWTWVAIDADTKLAITWIVGGRDADYGRPFIQDLADRLEDRVQLTSDGWQVYLDAVKRAFGDDVDYAMLIKTYANDRIGEARYSPAICVAVRSQMVMGNPDESHVNTSYVERQNLTMRMGMRRFTRLTNAHSKKLANHMHAIALHYFYYNWIRRHMTVKTTPAVAAGLASRPWTMLDFVQMLEDEEAAIGGRVTNYLPAQKQGAV